MPVCQKLNDNIDMTSHYTKLSERFFFCFFLLFKTSGKSSPPPLSIYFRHRCYIIKITLKRINIIDSSIGARLSDSRVLYDLFQKTKMIKIDNLMCISVNCNKTITENPRFSHVKKCVTVHYFLMNTECTLLT